MSASFIAALGLFFAALVVAFAKLFGGRNSATLIEQAKELAKRDREAARVDAEGKIQNAQAKAEKDAQANSVGGLHTYLHNNASRRR